MKTAYQPWEGFLQFDGWAGRWQSPVRIVGETSAKYRITSDKPVRLAGKNRWLSVGESALVPKHAVRRESAQGVEVIQ